MRESWVQVPSGLRVYKWGYRIVAIAADCKSAPSGSVVQVHLPPQLNTPIAQWLEQDPYTVKVIGSSPIGSTGYEKHRSVAQLVRALV